MGRKKFIDKKNSATFQLLARDSADPNPDTDRVFVRIDTNPYASHGFLEEDESENPQDSAKLDAVSSSIFADAPGDADSDEEGNNWVAGHRKPVPSHLPDHVRSEILELGLPDDGYNYLLHLREIKNAGGGSSFYQNSKAKLDQLPLDVQAYDASRVQINSEVEENPQGKTIYGVSERTIGVRVQKVVDPDVAALLDETDLRFGSDEDELEEDFVIRANLADESLVSEEHAVDETTDEASREEDCGGCSSQICKDQMNSGEDEWATEKPRVRRLLDEQFDLLTLKEYDSDTEYDDEDHDDAGYLEREAEPLASKLTDALKDHLKVELELSDKYRVPSDFLQDDEKASKVEEVDSPTDVIQKCREYAEMYSQEIEDVVVVEESSDELEEWDCETIVSTYSNLDNHPGRIGAPQVPKKRVVTTLSGVYADSHNVISLRGREKLPAEYLPHSRKSASEKMKKSTSSGPEQLRRKPHGAETKEEKKERKAAVKEERREARRSKKNLKELYRCEAQRAQKVAATTGPCSVHLM